MACVETVPFKVKELHENLIFEHLHYSKNISVWIEPQR